MALFFPAKHKWHLQNCGVPGSPWLCLSRFPCPGAANQGIHSGTLMGPPQKEKGCKVVAQPCTDCMEITQSLSSFLHPGNCWKSIKCCVIVTAKTESGDPNPADLNRRTCMVSLEAQRTPDTSQTVLSAASYPKHTPLVAFRDPGSLTLLWVWSRWREQGRRRRGAIPPISKERQG